MTFNTIEKKKQKSNTDQCSETDNHKPGWLPPVDVVPQLFSQK